MISKMVEYARHDARAGRFIVRDETSDVKAIEEVYKKNSYQRKIFKVQPGERWLDLGSNIGAFSVFAFSKGCQVVSYEAEPDNAEITRNNISLNGYAGEVYHKAIVADSYPSSSIDLYVSSRPMALRRHSVFPHKKDFVKVSVPTIGFSELLQKHRDYRCLKMNIEGVEIDILKERPDLSGIDKLVFEWSFDKDKKISTLKETLLYLKSQFSYVDMNKKIPNSLTWDFYPPNAFIYAIKI